MEVIVQRDYAAMSKVAAQIVAELLNTKPNAVLGMATGSTPLGLYQELVRLHKKEQLDFSRVTTFNLDEYVGLPVNHPQSYHYFMHEHFFRHVNIPPHNINIPSGTTSNYAAFCEWYERRIGECGGIDLQILGIGTDGHIAFNEPTSSLSSRTRLKTLSKQTSTTTRASSTSARTCRCMPSRWASARSSMRASWCWWRVARQRRKRSRKRSRDRSPAWSRRVRCSCIATRS